MVTIMEAVSESIVVETVAWKPLVVMVVFVASTKYIVCAGFDFYNQ
jgi:hypothetical protein